MTERKPIHVDKQYKGNKMTSANNSFLHQFLSYCACSECIKELHSGTVLHTKQQSIHSFSIQSGRALRFVAKDFKSNPNRTKLPFSIIDFGCLAVPNYIALIVSILFMAKINE